jgi:hypothetical protein
MAVGVGHDEEPHMKAKALVVAVLVSGAAQATEVPLQSTTPEHLAAVLRPAFDKVLRDPASAQFMDVHKYAGHGQHLVVCGRVNAKNAFGGYVGYRMFVLDPNTTGVTIAPIAEGEVPHSVDEQTQVNAFVAQFKSLCN